jgi:glycine oxidase
MNYKVDYLIIGQGLAGSILAYKLIEAGFSTIIIDETSGKTASRQATGIINPITGRRFVKSWMTNELTQCARKTYAELEKLMQTSLATETKITKIIASVEQLNDITSKFNDPEYREYLGNKIIHLDNEKFINPHGAVEILNVLQIKIESLLDGFKDYFNKKELLINEVFDYDSLIVNHNSLEYKNISAKNIVFCEGFMTQLNPFFRFLPLQTTKGEALIIHCPDLPEDSVIGGSCNITPIGNHTFYAGATYSWNDQTLDPTENKKNDLIAKLSETILCHYTIKGHKAGVRPTVVDRRPLAGVHPAHSNMFIFNGFGTKGLSLAPYFAEEFVAYLKGEKQLNHEINITRFERKKYV